MGALNTRTRDFPIVLFEATDVTAMNALTGMKAYDQCILDNGDKYEYYGPIVEWVSIKKGGAEKMTSDFGGAVGYGEGDILTISGTDNTTTESAEIETAGDKLYFWTTNACQFVVGDSVVAGENDPVLVPNHPYIVPFQSGWNISIRSIGTSGGSFYFHPVGGI